MANSAHQHIAEPQYGRIRRDGGRGGGRVCRGHARVYDLPGRITRDQAGLKRAVRFGDTGHTTITIG
ncbi:MAG TPA: hypothetical protein VGM07_19975 [Stellaceae bacterium]|jgi:hypothetical protein